MTGAKAPVYIAAGAIALAAIASFHHDLAIDEPFTALAIAHPAALGATLVNDDAPLYYVLLLGWSRVFGTSAVALRALSMVAFGGAILFTTSTARFVAGARAGVIAGALVATSVTFGLQPAATVRPYALVMMFAAMTLWASVRESRLAMFVSHLLGLFTHPIFVFFSIGSAGAGVAAGKRPRLFVAAPLGAVGVYAAAWGVMLARTAALPATSWMARPTVADAARGLIFWRDHATPILGTVLVILLLARGTRPIREHASSIAWLLLLTVFVLAGTIGVSMVRPVYFASRTPVLVLPAVAVACGVVTAELAPFLLTCGIALLVSASAVRYTARSALGPDPYPTRTSLAAIAPRMKCGDVIIAAGLSYAPLIYYCRTAGVQSCITIRPFPEDVREHPGWLDLTRSRRSTYARDAEVTASSVGRNGTLWTFVSQSGIGADAGTALIDVLSRSRAERESIALRGSFLDEVIAFHASSARPARP